MWYIEVKHSDQLPATFQIEEKDGGEGEANARFNTECANYARVRSKVGGTTELRLFRKHFENEIVYRQTRIECAILKVPEVKNCSLQIAPTPYDKI